MTIGKNIVALTVLLSAACASTKKDILENKCMNTISRDHRQTKIDNDYCSISVLTCYDACGEYELLDSGLNLEQEATRVNSEVLIGYIAGLPYGQKTVGGLITERVRPNDSWECYRTIQKTSDDPYIQ